MDWEHCEPDEYRLISQHYTAGRTSNIWGVVLHHNAGNLSIDDCYNVWMNREASAHYQVDMYGTVGQLVNDCDTAWACGNWDANCGTISIEHANNNSDPWTIWPAALESGAHLTAALCKLYGLGRPEWMVNVFPHNHFQATACPGEIAGSQNAEYMSRAQAWYDAMNGGCDPEPQPQPEPQPVTGFHVHMQAESAGMVLEEVTDNNDNAGIDIPMNYLAAWGDGFDLVVQANDLPKLTNPSNIKDHVNGCVGDGGDITELRMYSYFPNADHRIWYRVMTRDSQPNWLPWMKDNIDTGGSSDDFAGDGSPIYRVEAFVGDL